MSDCGSARDGGGGDLGELVLSEVDSEIAAVFEDGLEVGEVSEVVETDSGLHIVLRTAPEQRRRSLRMLHILVKHAGSARLASWRDPEGKQIGERTRDDEPRSTFRGARWAGGGERPEARRLAGSTEGATEAGA